VPTEASRQRWRHIKASQCSASSHASRAAAFRAAASAESYGEEDRSLSPAHPRKHRTHSAWVSFLWRPPGVWSSSEVLKSSCSATLTRSSAISSRPCASQHNSVEVPCLRWRPRKGGVLATAFQRHARATFTWEALLRCCSVLAQSGALKAEWTPMRVPELSGRVAPTCAHEGFEHLFLRQGPNPSIERTSNGGAHRFAPSKSVTPLAAAHVKR